MWWLTDWGANIYDMSQKMIGLHCSYSVILYSSLAQWITEVDSVKLCRHKRQAVPEEPTLKWLNWELQWHDRHNYLVELTKNKSWTWCQHGKVGSLPHISVTPCKQTSVVWRCDKGQYRVHNDKGIVWWPMIWSQCDLQNYSYLVQTDYLCLGVVFFFVRIWQ